jgi:hypothetical protein
VGTPLQTGFAFFEGLQKSVWRLSQHGAEHPLRESERRNFKRIQAANLLLLLRASPGTTLPQAALPEFIIAKAHRLLYAVPRQSKYFQTGPSRGDIQVGLVIGKMRTALPWRCNHHNRHSFELRISDFPLARRGASNRVRPIVAGTAERPEGKGSEAALPRIITQAVSSPLWYSVPRP